MTTYNLSSLLSNDQVHLILWALIFTGLFLVLLFIFQKKNIENSSSKINRFLGPLLIPLFWIHGVLFDPPNNWATLKKFGFFKFWFRQPEFSSSLTNPTLIVILIATGLIGLSLLLFIHFKRNKKPHRPSRYPYPAFLFWYLTAAFLHHIPDSAIDLQFFGGNSYPVSELLPSIYASLLLAIPAFLIALLFTMLKKEIIPAIPTPIANKK